MYKSIKNYFIRLYCRKMLLRIYFKYLDRLGDPTGALAYATLDVNEIKKAFFKEK
jgi:hypothetical protein